MNFLQSAQHKNVVSVIGWTRWEAGIAIITEYMPGGNLGGLLFDLNIPISPLLKLCWCTDISNGVSHIHNLFSKAKLIHGDIKPENILLTEDLRCKIGDFVGLKFAANSESTTFMETSLQSSSEDHITRQNAAPETLNNPQASLKHTHDVFSFGMIVYAILARVRPNQNCPEYPYEEAIMAGRRPDLSSIESNEQDMLNNGNENEYLILISLKNIMKKCWSRNPSNCPEMSLIYKEIYYLLYSEKLEDQNRAVRNTLACFKMYHPDFDKCETATVDELTL